MTRSSAFSFIHFQLFPISEDDAAVRENIISIGVRIDIGKGRDQGGVVTSRSNKNNVSRLEFEPFFWRKRFARERGFLR